FRFQHGVKRPANHHEPFIVTLTNHGAERLLGEVFRQYDVVIGVGQRRTYRSQAGFVGGEAIAAPTFVGTHGLVRAVDYDGRERQAVGTEPVCQVTFGGGTRLHTNCGVVELFGTGDTQFLLHHDALAVVIVNAGAHQAECRVTGECGSGIAGQDVDFAGLKRGETLLSSDRTDFELRGITKDHGCNGSADIDVDTI